MAELLLRYGNQQLKVAKWTFIYMKMSGIITITLIQNRHSNWYETAL